MDKTTEVIRVLVKDIPEETIYERVLGLNTNYLIDQEEVSKKNYK